MKTRKYIEIVYSHETQINLRNWALDNGFDLTLSWGQEEREIEDFEFHTTVMYSRNESFLPNEVRTTAPSEVKPIGFKLLDGFPIIELEFSGTLKRIFEHYVSMGLVHSYDDFIPHISISYSREDYNLKQYTLPNFPLIFDRLNVEDIEE